jgi:hypothetical protein
VPASGIPPARRKVSGRTLATNDSISSSGASSRQKICTRAIPNVFRHRQCNSFLTQRLYELAGEAVRVAGRVAALEPGLVDPQAAEIVAVREESDIGDKTSGGHIGVELGHPCPDTTSGSSSPRARLR